MATHVYREKDLDLGRLCVAMQKARLILRRAREERREMVRQYIGHHWNEEGTRLEVPVNLLSLAVRVLLRNLVARNPRGMLSTFNHGAKSIVVTMEKWANEQVEKMRLARTLRRVAQDALFTLGICKVALCSPVGAATTGWVLSSGDPYADRVDFDDFVFDCHARSFEECGWMGHRFRVPIDVARKTYGKEATKGLTAEEDRFFNTEGDERVSTLGRGYYSNQEEYDDFVDLWEVWMPRHQVVVTIADNYLIQAEGREVGVYGAKALKVQKWIGPLTGPYHLLSFWDTPDSALPKGLMQDLVGLHDSINNMGRKLINQCQRQKEVLGVSGGATDDAGRLQQASDGEMFRCDRPDALKPMKFGGPDQQLFAVFGAFQEVFSKLAGNLDIMGGLSPQSKTAHQDEMLNQNSSGTVADMQDAMVTFTAGVWESLCWYWHHHPKKVMRTSHSAPGLPDIHIERTVQPQQRFSIPWDELELKIDPYSLRHTTPQVRSAQLKSILTQILVPMAQLLQQQGIQLDMNTLLDKIGQYDDMPDLSEIITLREPPQTDVSPPSQDDQGRMPSETTRNYVRRSLGENAPGAKQNQYQEMMAQGQAERNGAQNGQS